MHATGHDVALGLIPFLDVNGEANLPTFFTVLLMLACVGLLLVAWRCAAPSPSVGTHYWAVLACGFLIMALDEFTSLHERLSVPLRHLLPSGASGALHYSWVIVGALIVVSVGVYFFVFLRSLRLDTRRNFILAGAIYVAGAVVLETIGGALAASTGEATIEYTLVSTFEETLEMIGLLLFLRALLHHLRLTVESVSLVIE